MPTARSRLVCLAVATLVAACGSSPPPSPPDLAASCTGAMVNCAGTCANLMSDNMNCGTCGVACPPGQSCASGTCCPTGDSSCKGICANLKADPANCGACGVTCATGQVCAAGACATRCPSSETLCNAGSDGGAAYCASIMSDNHNCGACGTVCPAGQACAGGHCSVTCPSGLVNCGGTCIDPTANDAFCGASADCLGSNAGVRCSSGQVCMGGICALSCQQGLVACDGTCIDPMTSRAHCGASGDCTGTAGGTACAAGQVCTNGACTVSCVSGESACPASSPTYCADLTRDVNNCGACGHACAAGQMCSSSQCVASCASPLTACNGSCVDTRFDPSNCGTCGKTCPTPTHETALCASGTCAAQCQAGYFDCNNSTSDGCETNVAADPKNCGSCGNVCPTPANASAACTSGACGLGPCNSGYGNCDNSATNGCEANFATDSNNCGGCGKPCSSGQTCSGGSCIALACQNGAQLLATSPNSDMIICHNPSNSVCEQDFGTECPPNWALCTPKQFANRQAGWNYTTPTEVLGVIVCRGGGTTGGAGSWTIPTGVNLSTFSGLNCNDGSSRPVCPAGYGCNEQQYYALCCKPTPTCGNGVVDSPEEDCDDGNTSEFDSCFNNCELRNPSWCG